MPKLALSALVFLAACETPSRPHRSASSVVAPRSFETAPVPTVSSGVERGPSLRQRVRTERVQINFVDESIIDALATIQTVTAIPIVVTREARDIVDREDLRFDFEMVAPLAVADLLDLMASRSDDLSWTIRYDVVHLTTGDEAGGDVFLAMYDVRDLVFARTQFVAPKIRNLPTGEDDEFRTGGELEDKVTFVEADTLVANIKDATGPEYWDREGGGTIDYLESGMLLVRANAEMHARIGGAIGR